MSRRRLRVAVIGDGGWGTALAPVLHGNGHNVTAWGPFADYIDDIRAGDENPRYLPGVELPSGIAWTSTPSEAVAGIDIAVS